MLKIPMTSLQPSKMVLRRFLAPRLEVFACRSYHGQSFPSGATEKQMTLPPNVMFDFKSSFAPQKEASVLTTVVSNTEGSLDENDDENSQGSQDYDFDDDDEHIDDEIDQDEIPLVFRSNSEAHHRLVKPLPERLHVPIHDSQDGQEVGSVWLDPSVFGVEEIRVDLIAQNVNYIRNKIRGVRKAKSKTISEKSGSGRKVRNQKGGGVARAGHSRPAHWRGGAKAHGPKNTKDYGNTKLNKHVRAMAMRSMLSQKLREGNLVVVNHLHLDSHKTRPWASLLQEQFGVGKALKKTRLRNNPDLEPTTSALILDHYLEPEENENNESENENDYHASYHGVPINLWVASSNIPRVMVRNHRFLNVYDCLRNEKLIVTLSAMEKIEEKWRE